MPGLDGMQKLIMAFVTLIIGIMLIGSLATQSNLVTDKSIATDEAIDLSAARIETGMINTSYQFTVANPPTTWKILDCPLASVRYGNSSTDFTVTTDYIFNVVNGTLFVKDTVVVNGTTGTSPNATIINYAYCGDDYVNVSWGRTLMDTTIGLFGLALLLVAIALFYNIYREYDIA